MFSDHEMELLMEEIDYDSFGNATVSHLVQGWDPTLLPFGFGGGLVDSDTGLIHIGARDYDPQTGTWTSRDPLGFDGGDTTLYSFAQNDPINLADPSGLGPNPDYTPHFPAAERFYKQHNFDAPQPYAPDAVNPPHIFGPAHWAWLHQKTLAVRGQVQFNRYNLDDYTIVDRIRVNHDLTLAAQAASVGDQAKEEYYSSMANTSSVRSEDQFSQPFHEALTVSNGGLNQVVGDQIVAEVSS